MVHLSIFHSNLICVTNQICISYPDSAYFMVYALSQYIWPWFKLFHGIRVINAHRTIFQNISCYTVHQCISHPNSDYFIVYMCNHLPYHLGQTILWYMGPNCIYDPNINSFMVYRSSLLIWPYFGLFFSIQVISAHLTAFYCIWNYWSPQGTYKDYNLKL